MKEMLGLVIGGKRLLLLIQLLFVASGVLAQSIVEVTDQTLKLGGKKEKILYYGFAEGDQIILSFSETNDKSFGEVEVFSYPDQTLYSEYKSNQVENKSIYVPKTGVYGFRFTNKSIGGRVCKIHIQRTPAEGKENFLTQVAWKDKVDTTWNTYTKDVVVGYDTTYLDKTRKVCVETKYSEQKLLTREERVHSKIFSKHNNKNVVYVDLPKSQISEYSERNVYMWTYLVVAYDKSADEFKKELSKCLNATAKALDKGTDVLSMFGVEVDPLTKCVIEGAKTINLPSSNISFPFYLVRSRYGQAFETGQYFEYKTKGNGGSFYQVFSDRNDCRGGWAFCLENTNIGDAFDVHVEVIAIIEEKRYEDEPYTEQIVTPRVEKQIFKDPIVNTVSVPYLLNEGK